MQVRHRKIEKSEKLKELGSSSESAWEQIKSGVEAALEELGKKG
jgi:hypothetical protein